WRIPVARRPQILPVSSRNHSSLVLFGPHFSGRVRFSANHFQMRLPAPWALQLEDELADFDFVPEIGQSPATSGASHLRLESARHPVPLRPSTDSAQLRVRLEGPGAAHYNPSKDGFISIVR